MLTEIYYFTGTGNSLWVAQKIAEQIGDAKLLSIPKIISQKTIVVSGKVGIVCPIYMYNIPWMVTEFITKITLPEYFYVVLAGGGEAGGCFRTIAKLCKTRNIELSAIFNIAMPGNYTPFGATPENEQQNLFKVAEDKIQEIARIVKSGERHPEKSSTSFLKSYIFPGPLYKMGYKMIPSMAKSYFTDEKCNGCGICKNVCPVDNIQIVDGKPVWETHCQQCYACLQWCPQEAIQYGKKTATVKRYHNPFISLKDIIKSNGQSLNGD